MPEIEFAHLKLPLVVRQPASGRGFGTRSDITEYNLTNRQDHAQQLRGSIANAARNWFELVRERETDGMPTLPIDMPLVLRCDPNLQDYEFLRGLGFEIIDESEDGVVLVATDPSSFEKLEHALQKFETFAKKSGSAANLHSVLDQESTEERLARILSPELLEQWGEIDNDQDYFLEVGINCQGSHKLSASPARKKGEEEAHFDVRLEKWQEKLRKFSEEQNELMLEREQQFESYVLESGGEILDSSFEQLEDSTFGDNITFTVHLKGRTIRDLVLNHPYVFDVQKLEAAEEYRTSELSDVAEPRFEVIPPSINAPKVCVVDSGLQEGHRLIGAAILGTASKSYVPNNTSVADEVREGGHGTRVAGAILYPDGFDIKGKYQLPFLILNARVLDETNNLPQEKSPSHLLREVITDYSSEFGVRIFNHSIAAANSYSCPSSRMSYWAHTIDDLSYDKDILVVQCTGNLLGNSEIPFSLGVLQHILAGRPYPNYLLEPASRITNPAQSLQALTVGSVGLATIVENGWICLGEKDAPSGFTRTGPGLWGSIKPDVVEYGGAWLLREGANPRLREHPNLSPELLRVSPEGPAYARDSVGTSFSTPKVTNVVATLEELYPTGSTLLYRALVAQSARWPQWALRISTEDALRILGYGIPQIDVATSNHDYRVTMIRDQQEIWPREAHIFEVPIPLEFNIPGEDYDVRVEITLSYSAKPRRTRKAKRRYLSTWLNWTTSKVNESKSRFTERIKAGNSAKSLQWKFGQTSIGGRDSGTLLKDIATIKSNQLPDSLCIAVMGHEGWDTSMRFPARYALAVSLEVVNREIAIYDSIRVRAESLIEQEVEIEV
ncbi:MAG TPA: S8 family peptidase [Candidatus Kapabacteria bacterium]|nr:S8 family peptidase [Candidatus Kapabacteria bacterium]